MQQGRATNDVTSGWRKTHLPGDGAGNLHDAKRVAVGERRLGIDDAGEGFADRIDALSAELAHGAWIERQHRAAGFFDVVGGQAALPEAAGFVQGPGYGDQLRVKPFLAAGAQGGDGGVRALRDGEGVDVLRDETDAREHGDLRTAFTPGEAGAIPVLIEVAHRLGDRTPELEVRGDIGAPLTAQRKHLLGVIFRRGRDLKQMPGTLEERCLRAALTPEFA